MTRTAQPNRRMIDAAHLVTHHQAQRFTLALQMLGQVQAAADERSQSEKVHTSGTTSSVERIAMTRYEARTRLEDMRDHLDDWLNTTDLFGKAVEDVIAWCHRMLGTTPPPLAVVQLCDGKAKGYDGHELAWVANSHNPANGWHDPTCREIAGPLGVCDACRLRMNRWRTRNGLTPIGVVAA